jgi:hypothetical protein
MEQLALYGWTPGILSSALSSDQTSFGSRVGISPVAKPSKSFAVVNSFAAAEDFVVVFVEVRRVDFDPVVAVFGGTSFAATTRVFGVFAELFGVLGVESASAVNG